MQISIAQRLQHTEEYYFSKKLKEIDQLNAEGKNVINLGIGSPDLPPHPDVIKELHSTSALPNTHSYQSYRGAAVLRQAMSDWYRQYYGVELSATDEILPLIGSKEGIVHICMTYLQEGDQALVPNPGYPAYSAAVRLSGAEAVYYTLDNDNNWLPDLQALEQLDLSKVKMMWINYPHMPSGTQATLDFFEQVVAFGRKHQILICHDNPYSFILNDQPLSLLQIDGAMEVSIELNSLSKSSNMAGWRVGMLLGSSQRIDEVLRFKSNMDSGMFLPLQLAAAKALQLDNSWYIELNKEYRLRREKVYKIMDILGCEYRRDQVGLFVWGRIPPSYQSGYDLTDKLLNDNQVFVTPGGIFGSAGDKYIRISLCANHEKLDAVLERIQN